MERLDQEGFEYFLRTQRSKLVVRDKNWDYKRKMIVILATMLLAAGRTALMLFDEALAATRQLVDFGVSEGATHVYALIMAFLSLLAIEGYLVNKGIDHGKKVGTRDATGHMIQSIIPAGFPVGIAVMVSMLAGLGVSIAPVTWIANLGAGEFIQTALGIVVGIGVSVLAYAAGEDYGRAQNDEHMEEEHWRGRMWQAWLSSERRRSLLREFNQVEEIAAPP